MSTIRTNTLLAADGSTVKANNINTVGVQTHCVVMEVAQ